jgi:hypothetical protein
MKTKPWPLMILALLNFLSPLTNVFLSARLEHIPILAYLHNTTFADVFPILLAPWISAFAIYSVKKWSYPVFLSVTAYQIGSLFYQAHSYPEILTIRWVFFITVLNLGVVSYFMNSKVRTVYYDQRLKWWESQPRYVVSMDCSIGGKEGWKAKVLNISQGGVFLQSSKELQIGTEVEISFQPENAHIVPMGKVLYFRNGGYGVNFIHNHASEVWIEGLIKNLKRHGAQSMQGRFSKMEDFRNWAKTKALRSEGWIPEVQIEKILEEEKKTERV